ncbi:ferredoxin [Micromonospora sp. WMMD1082]|uniref:ferredoxin n=1 Tax=Micromonospora sp. WMMD1082 TaxID=3016104 RepID=UPI002415976C|nr:ferredoxin [Micromonospora sp. WMMD1082]MDG4794581.1 ferredoxin [Micromonospora sp. WMMD1082]
MRVAVDSSKCQDTGQCFYTAPEVFIASPDHRLGSVVAEPDESLRDLVEEAADGCPLHAISVEG